MSRRRSEFDRFSIVNYLTWPFKVFWRWGSSLASDDTIRDRQSNPVVSVLLAPLRFLFACVLFLINSWATTRHVFPFLYGVPAMLAVTGVAGAVWLDYFRYPNKVARTQKYYENFLMDPERGPEIAQHFALKKVSLQPDNPSAKFDLATVWEALSSMDTEEKSNAYKFLASQRSKDLMTSLANNEHAMAHVWFAKRYMTNREIDLTMEERSEKIDEHLKKALEIDPENNPAKITKADHFLAKATRFEKGSPEFKEALVEASKALQEVVESGTGEIIWHLPKLMKILFDLGDPVSLEKAQKAFQVHKRELDQFMRKFPSDERIPQIWIVLIGSAIQLKDYKSAEDLIDQGKRQTDNSRIVNMFDELNARLLIQQVEDLEELDTAEKFDKALDILSKGILVSPTNASLSNRLAQFILPSTNDGKQLDFLEKSTSVSAPSVAHLLMGIRKVMNGDAMAGQQYWKIADGQAANSQIILFSLIRSLMVVYDDQFENRRDVIALAIEQFPNQGLFYFLRGSDLCRHEKFTEAIPDLIQAAEMIREPMNFEILVQVARCYKAMNQQEKYDDQLRDLQRLIQRADPSRKQMLDDLLSELNN